MTRNEILIAIPLLQAQIENSLLTDYQSLGRLNELIAATELLERDDTLAHDLVMVRSLMALHRHQRALDVSKMP